jgi:uncharacterized protein (DUF2147 family)
MVFAWEHPLGRKGIMVQMWNSRATIKYLFLTILIGISSFLRIEATSPDSESPVGFWRTIDDKTGKPSAIIEISLHDGTLTGKIIKTLNYAHPGLCIKCAEERKNQPIIGLVIVRGLTQKSRLEWTKGRILDPEIGTEYKCKITLIDNGNKMVVRGFIGFSLFGRSQIWSRENY